AIMPSFKENPRSSLSCMIEILMNEFGGSENAWAMRQRKWDWRNLSVQLKRWTEEKRQTVLFGTAFGWVHFLDWCAARKLRFRMPPTTLVFETGGYKGRSRELERSDLHRDLAQ